MPNPAESSREVLQPEGESLPLAPGHPVLPNDIRLVFTALDLYRSLGRMEKAIEILEEKVARQENDLNGLGRVAHTTVSFGQLVLALIAGGLLTALVLHFLK
jgi:hypothetical protein